MRFLILLVASLLAVGTASRLGDVLSSNDFKPFSIKVAKCVPSTTQPGEFEDIYAQVSEKVVPSPEGSCKKTTAAANPLSSHVSAYIPTWFVWRTAGNKLDLKNPAQFSKNLQFVYPSFYYVGNGRNATPWHDEVPNTERYILSEFEVGVTRELIKLLVAQHYNVMLSIGGWNHETRAFSDLVANKEGSQMIFLKSALDELNLTGAYGLDFDWEFPGDVSRGGHPDDRANLPMFYKTVKQFMIKNYKPTFQLHTAVGIAPIHAKEGYDIDQLLAEGT